MLSFSKFYSMNSIPCLGLDFLAKCSQSHISDHFLFNLETAVSSLAIIVAIYALFLERRFRVRIGIKNSQLKDLIFIVLIVLELTFIAATLPYISGTPRPLVGYPIFWEILAFLLLVFAIFQSYNLLKPIRKLSKSQVHNLIKSAPYDTVSYHGSVDLLVKEADYFWTDFLLKSIKNNSLRKILTENFTNEDFLKVAVKSQYILLQTVEVIGKSKPTDNIEHIKNFLRTLFLYGMTAENSVIVDDLKSSYKPILQHMIRKRKLGSIILGYSTDLFFLRHNLEGNHLAVLERFVKIFELYLGRQYHHTDDKSQYLSLIHSEVLDNLLKFFKDNLLYLNFDEKSAFLKKLSFLSLDLSSLPEKESEMLADGIYEILEDYAIGRDWRKDSESERFLCIEIARTFVECNKHTKKIFKKRLLAKIVGSENKKEAEYFSYNLKGYYPMMIPVYFFIYGHELFSKTLPEENFKFNMTILKKMQESLPKIAEGKTQRFMDADIPDNERSANAIKRKAENCLDRMFPESIVYNKEENSITYYFSGDEASRTLLLNETVKENELIFREQV